jgi:SAM-dependent methyltransferase
MKLHLGCGNKIIDGFINIDFRENDGVDIVADLVNLTNFGDNSIELIYCSHVLEHFGRLEYKSILKKWYDLLIPGGILRLAVPDMEMVIEHYNENKDLEKLRGLIWGGQNYEKNIHYCGWDFNTLKKDLTEVGFTNVYRYDWRQTEHSNIDDYSQCYLPHMDKENGKLMSLNVESVK